MVSTRFILVIGFIYCAKFANAVCKHTKLNGGVSEKEAQQILDLHNNVRLEVAQGQLPGQPKGINLKRMTWDDKLAQLAQDVADICEHKHKVVTHPDFSVGQNLASTWDTKPTNGAADWDKAVNIWINEYTVYTYPDDGSPETGEYTQIVSANCTQLGCGYTYFRTDDSSKYQKLYVCHYGHGGNHRGQAPYETGASGCENLC